MASTAGRQAGGVMGPTRARIEAGRCARTGGGSSRWRRSWSSPRSSSTRRAAPSWAATTTPSRTCRRSTRPASATASTGASDFGQPFGWCPLSAALIILIFPLGFRLTCYYYRKAYYRSFWLAAGMRRRGAAHVVHRRDPVPADPAKHPPLLLVRRHGGRGLILTFDDRAGVRPGGGRVRRRPHGARLAAVRGQRRR